MYRQGSLTFDPLDVVLRAERTSVHRRLSDPARQELAAYYHGPATGRWSYDTQGMSWWGQLHEGPAVR